MLVATLHENVGGGGKCIFPNTKGTSLAFFFSLPNEKIKHAFSMKIPEKDIFQNLEGRG